MSGFLSILKFIGREYEIDIKKPLKTHYLWTTIHQDNLATQNGQIGIPKKKHGKKT
jgi:hypothetical protein